MCRLRVRRAANCGARASVQRRNGRSAQRDRQPPPRPSGGCGGQLPQSWRELSALCGRPPTPTHNPHTTEALSGRKAGGRRMRRVLALGGGRTLFLTISFAGRC